MTVFIALFGLVLAACAPSAVQTPAPATKNSIPLPPSNEPTMEAAVEPTAESSGRISFDQLGMSLEVPEGLVVIKDPIVNLDDPSKLESYRFYIQNYGPNGAPTENYFQV